MNNILKKGTLAPDFSLLLEDGSQFTLSAQAGRQVVLFFYPKDDTDGCTRENVDFSNLADSFAAVNTTVIGISPDDVASHRAFRDKYDLKIPLAADPDHIAIDAYGVWGEKKNFGKVYMGLIRTTYLIDASGRVAEHWKVSRVKGHAEAVLQGATALASKQTAHRFFVY